MWWKKLRQRRTSIDRLDYEGIARLMANGFTLQDTLHLLESPANQMVFQEIETRLQNGEELTSFFPDCCPKAYRMSLEGFLKCLSFSEALSLCLEVVNGEQQQRQEYRKGLFYPCMMFLCTLAGVILFNEFCFPPLLSMMKGFHVESTHYDLLRVGFRLLSGSVILLLLLSSAILLFFRQKSHRIQGYLLCAKYAPNSIYIQYESTDFIRFFLQCVRMHVPTRESLRILASIEQKPVICFLARTIETALVNGDSFEEALDVPWLDPSLLRFLKIALYSSEMESILERYLEMARQRSIRQCKRITKSVQILSYACIGVILILVYEVLMLPLQILTQL